MKQTNILYLLMWSEIITTAKVGTVVSNAVQRWKRHLPKRTKCHSIGKVRKWDDTYLRYGSFFMDDQNLNVADTFKKYKNNRVI